MSCENMSVRGTRPPKRPKEQRLEVVRQNMITTTQDHWKDRPK